MHTAPVGGVRTHCCGCWPAQLSVPAQASNLSLSLSLSPDRASSACNESCAASHPTDKRSLSKQARCSERRPEALLWEDAVDRQGTTGAVHLLAALHKGTPRMLIPGCVSQHRPKRLDKLVLNQDIGANLQKLASTQAWSCY